MTPAPSPLAGWPTTARTTTRARAVQQKRITYQKLCLPLGYGAAGITVAKLGEAEVMADAGMQDILLAYPLWGRTNCTERISQVHGTRVLVTAYPSTARRELAFLEALHGHNRITRFGNPIPSRLRGKAGAGGHEPSQRPREASMDLCVHSR